MFNTLINNSPEELQKIIRHTLSIEQNPYYHPEGNVYIHTEIVTCRLIDEFGDVNLTMAGLFHDLGKIKATYFDEKKQAYTSPNHDSYSLDIIDQFEEFIIGYGADIEIVRYIVGEHMRVKYLRDFRVSEQIKMINHPHFKYLKKFESADYGGDDPWCRDIDNYDDLLLKISLIKEQQTINELVREKFNGNIIMNEFPEFTGKRLGQIMNFFKNSHADFQTYALNTNKCVIIQDFKKFIKCNKIVK